jgi:hypothetical protein
MSQLTPSLVQLAGRFGIATGYEDWNGRRVNVSETMLVDEYPNWRVPLSGPDARPVWLEDVFTDPMANALAEAMKTGTAVNPAETGC